MTSRSWLTKDGLYSHLLAILCRTSFWVGKHAPGKVGLIALMVTITGSQWYGLIDLFGVVEARRIMLQIQNALRRKPNARTKVQNVPKV